jgi:predicted nucleic acid-binding protein
MVEIFADTGFWIALLLKRDRHYTRALQILQEMRTKAHIVTSEYVLLEFLNHFSKHGPFMRGEAMNTWKALYASKETFVIPVGHVLLERAATLYERSVDKSWSLTDCSSFVIMRERKIQDALTFDHHFEQAGFRALLQSV